MNKDEFIERFVGWIMPDRKDPELAAAARAHTCLKGLYTGKSQRIHRLIRIAYLRGCRRGASCVWSAGQKVTTRALIPTQGDAVSEPADEVKLRSQRDHARDRMNFYRGQWRASRDRFARLLEMYRRVCADHGYDPDVVDRQLEDEGLSLTPPKETPDE